MIRIEFERNRVICQGIEVLTGQPEEGTLPFTLFRDVEWLEFNEGIKLEEIREVLSIIHRYSILATEPEGDIVTAFWEARFDHVQYKVSDFFTGQISDQIDKLSESDTRPSSSETEAHDKTTSSEISPANDPALFGDIVINSSSNYVKSLDLSLITRISNAVNSYVIYLIKTMWPFDLALFYPFYYIKLGHLVRH